MIQSKRLRPTKEFVFIFSGIALLFAVIVAVIMWVTPNSTLSPDGRPSSALPEAVKNAAAADVQENIQNGDIRQIQADAEKVDQEKLDSLFGNLN